MMMVNLFSIIAIMWMDINSNIIITVLYWLCTVGCSPEVVGSIM